MRVGEVLRYGDALRPTWSGEVAERLLAHVDLRPSKRVEHLSRGQRGALTDYLVHTRTVILASHLIEEVDRLLVHVIVLDRGRVLVADEADALRARGVVPRSAARETRVSTCSGTGVK